MVEPLKPATPDYEKEDFIKNLKHDLEYARDIVKDNRTESEVYFKTQILKEVFYSGVNYGNNTYLDNLDAGVLIDNSINALEEDSDICDDATVKDVIENLKTASKDIEDKYKQMKF